jgi:hypothetical protein
MFMKKVKIASALALAFAASTASATDFDLKVGVLDQGNQEGFVVGASVVAVEGLTIAADYKAIDDSTFVEAGFEYEIGVTEKVDLVGGLSYVQMGGTMMVPTDVDMDTGEWTYSEVDIDTDAFTMHAGVKTTIADAVDFEFGIERLDGDDYQDLAPYLSASVDVTDSVAVSFEHREVMDESAVVLTWSF